MFVDITDESAQLLTGTSLQSNLVGTIQGKDESVRVPVSQCKDRAEREN